MDGVKINSIHASNIIDDPDWFNTRVKCFPVYSLLLAMNMTNVDLMVIEAAGTELQVNITLIFLPHVAVWFGSAQLQTGSKR